MKNDKYIDYMAITSEERHLPNKPLDIDSMVKRFNDKDGIVKPGAENSNREKPHREKKQPKTIFSLPNLRGCRVHAQDVIYTINASEIEKFIINYLSPKSSNSMGHMIDAAILICDDPKYTPAPYVMLNKAKCMSIGNDRHNRVHPKLKDKIFSEKGNRKFALNKLNHEQRKLINSICMYDPRYENELVPYVDIEEVNVVGVYLDIYRILDRMLCVDRYDHVISILGSMPAENGDTILHVVKSVSDEDKQQYATSSKSPIVDVNRTARKMFKRAIKEFGDE